MKKKITICFIILVGFAVVQSYGQQAYSATPENPILSFTTQSTVYDEKTKGSPYMNEDFQYGEVEINDKLALTGKMRFNAYKNEVEVLEADGDDSYYSLLKRSYIKVKIGDKPYNIYQYRDNSEAIRTSYFVELNKGPVILLFKPEARLKKGRVPNTSYDKYVPPTYVWSNSYYLVDTAEGNKDAIAAKVRLSKKDFLRFFNDSSQEALKSFIKKEELKLKRKDEAIKLLEFYNNL